MNHFSKIIIEISAKTPVGSLTEEQLNAVTDKALEMLAYDTLTSSMGKEFDNETGSLKYDIKVVRNEIV